MATTIYIDGYNVLHQSRILKPLLRQDLETAREGLIDKVAAYCVATGKRVILVFDGHGEHQAQRVEHHRSAPTLEVIYAPGHLSADAVIERFVYQTRDKLEATVVTNDRGIRDLCRGMGALVMEADNFLLTVREARQELMPTLQDTRRKARESHLEDRLDPKSLEQLQQLRKKL